MKGGERNVRPPVSAKLSMPVRLPESYVKNETKRTACYAEISNVIESVLKNNKLQLLIANTTLSDSRTKKLVDEIKSQTKALSLPTSRQRWKHEIEDSDFYTNPECISNISTPTPLLHLEVVRRFLRGHHRA